MAQAGVRGVEREGEKKRAVRTASGAEILPYPCRWALTLLLVDGSMVDNARVISHWFGRYISRRPRRDVTLPHRAKICRSPVLGTNCSRIRLWSVLPPPPKRDCSFAL